jgi:hypothetical protein
VVGDVAREATGVVAEDDVEQSRLGIGQHPAEVAAA